MEGRLHGLDALRGVAALIVAWHHLEQFYEIGGPPVAAISAVDLFLVVSGFVMARTYEHRMPAPRDFLRIRYRRLWPVMALGTSIGAVAIVLAQGPSIALAATFIATLLFLPFGFFAVNLPAWSLFTEVLSNYFHSRVFGALTVRALMFISGALGLAFVAGTLATGRVTWGSDYPSLAIATLRCLYCYVIGIVIFRVHGEQPLGKFAGLALAGSGVLLVFGNTIPPVLFSIVFAVVAAPFLVRATLYLQPSWLATAAGELSFPLYAVHVPVIMVALTFGGGPGAAASAALLLATAIAYISTRRRGPRLSKDKGMGRTVSEPAPKLRLRPPTSSCLPRTAGE